MGASDRINEYNPLGSPSPSKVPASTTLQTPATSVWTGATKSNMPTSYGSVSELLANYQNAQGRFDSNSAARLAADLRKNEVKELQINGKLYTVIDGRYDGNIVEGTVTNDVFIPNENGETTKFVSEGGHDILLNPGSKKNPFILMGDENADKQNSVEYGEFVYEMDKTDNNSQDFNVFLAGWASENGVDSASLTDADKSRAVADYKKQSGQAFFKFI